MRRKTFLIVIAAATVLVSSAIGLSQFRGDAVVVVPVNVRDSEGRLVTGLSKDDFVISEDGVRQTIRTFSLDPVPLSAAIVVDDGMGGEALKRLVPLLEVMTSGFTAEDEMASFRYDHFVWKLSDFTNDQKSIQKSYGELAKIAESRPAQGEPGDPVAAAPGWLRTVAGLITIGSNGPPPGGPNSLPGGAQMPRPAPTSRILHNAVYDAAMALKARPESRRRIIFLISDGQVSGAGNTRKLEDNVDFLLQNGIQVYSVATDYALREGPLGLLNVYAKATGGDVYGGGSTRDMETAFLKITEQARNQYVLGYISSNEPRGLRTVRRELHIETTHPGHRVTHRRSYIQIPAR